MQLCLPTRVAARWVPENAVSCVRFTERLRVYSHIDLCCRKLTTLAHTKSIWLLKAFPRLFFSAATCGASRSRQGGGKGQCVNGHRDDSRVKMTQT